MQRERGITLVALGVTIIILLILAGITLSFTAGKNGIIKKAQEAQKQQIIAETKENIGMEILETQIEVAKKDEAIKQEQIKEIISNYGQLQEDGDTIIIKNTNYEISLSEIYADMPDLKENDTEDKKIIALLEARIENLNQQIKDLNQQIEDLNQQDNKVMYQVTTAIFNNVASSNAQVVMPSSETYRSVVGGRTIAGFVSNKVTLVENSKIMLPKGSYTFESFVPTRTQTYGTGYKVFNDKGELLVDHTYASTTNHLATNNFNLEEATNITIYWYRTHSGWTDITYYRIKSI